jgi:hypothetical protein
MSGGGKACEHALNLHFQHTLLRSIAFLQTDSISIGMLAKVI